MKDQSAKKEKAIKKYLFFMTCFIYGNIFVNWKIRIGLDNSNKAIKNIFTTIHIQQNYIIYLEIYHNNFITFIDNLKWSL